METRTSYVLVGAFLLAATVGLIVFIIWSVKSDTSSSYTIYRAYFSGSVSGLSNGSDVRYRGIPIGRVTDIRIDPDNVEKIRVTMDIVSTTPIKTDSVATIEMAGITGVAFIQIEGGSQTAPALEVAPGRKFPVIKTKRSGLEALFDEAPKLIQRVIALTDDASKLLDEGNRSALAETLENIRQLSSVLAGSSTRVAEIIDDSAATAAEFRVAAKDVSAMANEARERTGPLLSTAEDTLRNVNAEIKNLSGDAGKMFDQLSTTAKSLTEMSDQLSGLIAENREPIRDFTSDGLYNFTRMIAEMRALVDSLQRIAMRLESDPSNYLFGGANQGYQAK